MLDFVVNIVRRLNIGQDAIRVGAVSYSNISRVDFTLNQYFTKNEVISAIRNIQYMDAWTNTAAGINDMRTKVFSRPGDRPNVPNVCVLITDGVSNIDRTNTVPNANLAKTDGILMLAVGITSQAYEPELKKISSTGVKDETYWLPPDFRVTNDIIESIVRRTCDNIELGRFQCNISKKTPAKGLNI